MRCQCLFRIGVDASQQGLTDLSQPHHRAATANGFGFAKGGIENAHSFFAAVFCSGVVGSELAAGRYQTKHLASDQARTSCDVEPSAPGAEGVFPRPSSSPLPRNQNPTHI